MSARKMRKILESTAVADLIPVPLFRHEENETGAIILCVPKFKNQTFGKLFLSKKASPDFKIDLDETGSRVYKHINGERTFAEICALVEEDGKQPIEQLKERSLQFIMQLFQHQYITFKNIQHL
jgi:hypothetical protein